MTISSPVSLAKKFLSTPSARRATAEHKSGRVLSPISIHALREEGDLRACFLQRRNGHFYPRPPRGGRRPTPAQMITHSTFLSTPSARRATGRNGAAGARSDISIHALREEGDGLLMDYYTLADLFLSTPSARRATIFGIKAELAVVISIHALREEGDRGSWWCRVPEKQFLSTPSARRATKVIQNILDPNTFLSTPSARRATVPQQRLGPIQQISIHALREEGDKVTTSQAQSHG